MSLKTFFIGLFKALDGEPELPPKENHEAKIAAMDSAIERTFKAIVEKANTCPEAIDAAISGLDSISLNMRRDTDKLKEGGIK